MTTLASRRTFLRYLAASPALTPTSRAFAQLAGDGEIALIEDVADAVNVFDFEPFAKANLTTAHFTYMAMGVDNDATLACEPCGFRTSADPSSAARGRQ